MADYFYSLEMLLMEPAVLVWELDALSTWLEIIHGLRYENNQ